jgi:hypothetical protein
MVEGKICPFCQVRNAQNVERCVRCGRPFPGSKDQHETTDQITKTEPELTGFLPNVDQLAPLAKDTLVLFVNGEEEAVLLEDMQEVILGRPSRTDLLREADVFEHGLTKRQAGDRVAVKVLRQGRPMTFTLPMQQ